MFGDSYVLLMYVGVNVYSYLCIAGICVVVRYLYMVSGWALMMKQSFGTLIHHDM